MECTQLLCVDVQCQSHVRHFLIHTSINSKIHVVQSHHTWHVKLIVCLSYTAFKICSSSTCTCCSVFTDRDRPNDHVAATVFVCCSRYRDRCFRARAAHSSDDSSRLLLLHLPREEVSAKRTRVRTVSGSAQRYCCLCHFQHSTVAK